MSNKTLRRGRDKIPTFHTLLGNNAAINGKISGSDNIVITGAMRGTTELEGAVMIMEGGSWEGEIKASMVFINGEVTGDITATHKLEILTNARIKGNISSPLIAIAEGAIHIGAISTTTPEEVVHFKERRQAATIEQLMHSDDNE